MKEINFELGRLHDLIIGLKEEKKALREEIEALQETNIINANLVIKYENVLREVEQQKGLLDFLDNNDWATTEDYFVYLSREAFKD
jgi:archaellum component FlaC